MGLNSAGLSGSGSGGSGGGSTLKLPFDSRQHTEVWPQYGLLLPTTAATAVTVFSIPAGTVGVVDKLQFNCDGNMNAVARLQISYDGGVTFPFDIELGSMMLTHYDNFAPSAVTSYAGHTENFGTAYLGATAGGATTQWAGYLRFPIYFTNGLVVRVLNVNVTVTGTYKEFFAQMSWRQTPLGSFANYQLRTNSVSLSQTNGSNVASVGSGATAGYTLTASNVSDNGLGVQLGASGIGQLASITGKGWVVGYSLMHYCSAGQAAVGRQHGFYIDADALPTATGTTTTPAHGLIYGTQVNGSASNLWNSGGGGASPSILGNAEDFFDTGWFANIESRPWSTYIPAFTDTDGARLLNTTTACILANAQGDTAGSAHGKCFKAFADIMAMCDGWGYRFESSMQLWLLAGSFVSVVSTPVGGLFYYADLS